MLATADGLSREVRVAATRLAKTRVLKTPVVSTHKTTSWGQPLRLHFKLENQQQTGSFKVRGATNKVLQLDDASTVRGSCCIYITVVASKQMKESLLR